MEGCHHPKGVCLTKQLPFQGKVHGIPPLEWKSNRTGPFLPLLPLIYSADINQSAPHSLFQIISLIETKEKAHQKWQYFSWSCSFRQYLHCRFCHKEIHCIFFLLLFFLLSHFIFWSHVCSWCPGVGCLLCTSHEKLSRVLKKPNRKYQMDVSELWRAAWSPVLWATAGRVFCSLPPWLRRKWIAPSGWLFQSLQQGNFLSEALDWSNCGACGVLLLEGSEDNLGKWLLNV